LRRLAVVEIRGEEGPDVDRPLQPLQLLGRVVHGARPAESLRFFESRDDFRQAIGNSSRRRLADLIGGDEFEAEFPEQRDCFESRLGRHVTPPAIIAERDGVGNRNQLSTDQLCPSTPNAEEDRTGSPIRYLTTSQRTTIATRMR
jgi:hypothetical protein